MRPRTTVIGAQAHSTKLRTFFISWLDKFPTRPSNFFRSSTIFGIALTLLNEGCIFRATCNPAPIDLAMLSNTVSPNPSNALHRWRVMEAVSPEGNRTRHVCGENAASSFGVSTSAIQEFDALAMTVKTRSGKTYSLDGPPDNTRLGEGAWRKWCNDNGIVSERDVTSEYLKADQPAVVIKSTATNIDSSPTIKFKRLGFRYQNNASV